MSAPEALEISFEYFPPVAAEAVEKFEALARRLAGYRPSFVSVTYGAGGGTRERTLSVIEKLRAVAPPPVAGHLTVSGASRAQTMAVAARYRELGVDHVVALRGDPVKGEAHFAPHPEGFASAAELAEALSAEGFAYDVAGYAEPHPESLGETADWAHLKRKASGARRVLTQFAFDDAAIARFRDRCVAEGIAAQVTPGIMPIVDFEQLCKFAARCGARIPAWLHEAFAKVSPEDKAARRELGDHLAAEQVDRLRAAGFRAFHIYTLNRADPTEALCAHLGRAPEAAAA